MEESSEVFIAELQSAIQDKHNYINEQTLSILTESISTYKKSFETVVNSLIHSGLLVEDPYHSSGTIHEIKIPSAEPILPESKMEELSIRLAEYIKQLDFLESNYNFSLDAMNIARLPVLIKFFKHINWSRLIPTSASPVECGLAGIEQQLIATEGNLALGIFRDGRKRMADYGSQILNALKDISIFLRENYKLEVRNRVIPLVVIDPSAARRQTDQLILSLKKDFRQEMGEQPFYTELIKEILLEDYSSKGPALRAGIIKKINQNNAVSQQKSIPEIDEEENIGPGLLLEGFRLLSTAGPVLLKIAEKMIHNSDIIENSKPTLFQLIIGFFKGRRFKTPDRIYNVIIFNAEDETGSKLKIDLNRFEAELKKEGNNLLSCGSKTGLQHRELEQASPDEINTELTKHIKKVYRFISIIPAIDQHLKERANNAMRGSMNGIRLDLNDIQSSLIKSNKRRLEYEAMDIPGMF